MIDRIATSIGRTFCAWGGGGRSRLGLASVALLCGFGLAASGVTLVRAADDAGVFDFFRSPALDRMIDPIRLRPRYASEPRFVYRPRGEIRRREARRREARRAEIRRAAPARRAARRIVEARQPRPAPGEPVRERPTLRHAPAVSAAAGATGASAVGRRTMCVRTCDGYLFPVGTLHSRADLPTHETACHAACPAAETRLYTLAPGQTLESPAGARSVLDGTVYAKLKTAFLFRKTVVASCDCQTPGLASAHLPILLDPTLRRGDVVVDGQGNAQAFAGPPRVPASRQAFAGYETSRALSGTAKAQVDKLMGTTLRRKIAAAYERSERRRLAGLPDSASSSEAAEPRATRLSAVTRAAFREVSPPAGSDSRVRAFTVTQQGGTVHASGARIITVE